MTYDPSDDDLLDHDPYAELDSQDREWESMLESEPEVVWRYLVALFSEVNASELKIQQEAFEKARLQAQEMAEKAPDKDSELAIADIHEMLLMFESASNEASKHTDE